MITSRYPSTLSLESLVERYRNFLVPPVSYATVRDYCDSIDHLGALAEANKDMKDCQRCWMLKAIVGNVARGARLLEIGAGEPLVADLLSQLGYDVTIVDPYDGRANGPAKLEWFRRQYPHLEFFAETFDDKAGLPGRYDCIYSISVLEHIALDDLANVFSGIRRYGNTGVVSLHAVDHVLLGAGAEYHFKMLDEVAGGCGIAAEALSRTLEAAVNDPETYFLSARAHNMWRGKLSYDEFPMRRCISMQFCQVVV